MRSHLLILRQRSLLRIAGILNHVVAVFVFNAPVYNGGKKTVFQFKLNGNLLDAAVVIKTAVNTIRIICCQRRENQQPNGQNKHENFFHKFRLPFLCNHS